MEIDEQLAQIEQDLSFLSAQVKGKISRADASDALLALEAKVEAMKGQLLDLQAQVRATASHLRALTNK